MPRRYPKPNLKPVGERSRGPSLARRIVLTLWAWFWAMGPWAGPPWPTEPPTSPLAKAAALREGAVLSLTTGEPVSDRRVA